MLAALIGIVVVVMADKAVYNFYINFKSLGEEIEFNENKLVKLKAVSKRAEAINSEYEKTITKYKGLKKSDNLLQEISGIARRLGVNIINIKPSLTKEEAKFKTYSIKIESQDDVSTFARFLYALTEELKSVGVKRVEILAQGKDELPLISLTASATVFAD